MPRDRLITFRSGSGVPNAADFDTNEPAWNSADGKLYVKNSAGAMVEIGAITNASNLTGTVALANGGTGSSTGSISTANPWILSTGPAGSVAERFRITPSGAIVYGNNSSYCSVIASIVKNTISKNVTTNFGRVFSATNGVHGVLEFTFFVHVPNLFFDQQIQYFRIFWNGTTTTFTLLNSIELVTSSSSVLTISATASSNFVNLRANLNWTGGAATTWDLVANIKFTPWNGTAANLDIQPL